MKIGIIKIFAVLILVFSSANAVAQDSSLVAYLLEYNYTTRLSKIHIQNNADFDLNEIDFYINDFRAGRVAGTLPKGKAVVYFQSLTPGSHEIKIKTREGIEFKEIMEFKAVESTEGTAEAAAQAAKTKTDSELSESPEYQEYLREKQIEQEIIEQRRQEELQKEEPQLITREVAEEEELPEKQESNRAIAVIILILILAFVLPKLIKNKKRIH